MKSIFQTPGYIGCNVEFSPLIPNLFACATSQFFGLTGCGALYVLDHFPEDISNPIKCFRSLFWPRERLLDVTWSQAVDHILWSASGDGYIQIWDLNSYLPIEDPLSDFEPSPDPIRLINAHQGEINSIEWNKTRTDNHCVLTSSTDKTVKLWDSKTGSLMTTFNSQSPISSSSWSPLMSSTFASVSADGFLRIWNTKESSSERAVKELRCCTTGLTTVDWSRKNANIVVTGSNLGKIIGWDIRATSGPLFVINEHRKSVEKIKFSPHAENLFASVSCDNTTKIWDTLRCDTVSGPCLKTFKHHSDSVCGIDFNNLVRDEIVDCGRDSLVYLYSINSSIRSH
ncbi:Peroxisomal targeting signal 2 receptor [Halotydeus destructor]|nr:Peroxisomal targeting signal 2 receptor [Halotydeus destructor]